MQKRPLRCPQCGSSDTQFIVAAFIAAPVRRFFGHLTKHNIRRKEVRVSGVDWDHAMFMCSDCGWVSRPDSDTPPEPKPGRLMTF